MIGWPNGLKKVRISPSCRSYCVRLDVRLAPVQQSRQALQETQRLCPFPIRVARHGYGAVRPEWKMERQFSGPTNAVYASAWVPTLTSIKQINRFRSGDRRLHVCESAPASSMRRRIAV